MFRLAYILYHLGMWVGMHISTYSFLVLYLMQVLKNSNINYYQIKKIHTD